VRHEGHTENVGDVSDNQRLSEKRAEGVKKWSVVRGIASARRRCRLAIRAWSHMVPSSGARTR